MIRRAALRGLTTVAVTAALALPPLAQGAQAAAPVTAAAINADDGNPFRGTDTAVRTVDHPCQIRLVDSDFTRPHPRVDVRYGDPGHPDRARVVASAATLL